MDRVVHIFGLALRPLQATRHAVMPLDGAKVHLSPRVARACRRTGIYLSRILAGLTWLLPAAAEHWLHRCKFLLRACFQEAQLQSTDGHVPLAAVLHPVGHAARWVVNGHAWRSAFQDDGWGPDLRCVSRTALRKLGLSEIPKVSTELPTLAQMQVHLP